MAPGITEVASVAQHDAILRELQPTQLMVIDFHAVWCGPCHAIAPVFQQLAGKFAHVKFIKVDVDKVQQLAQRYRVSAMPTFKFIKGGKEVDELKGASPPQLNAKVAQHAGPVPAQTASGSGSSSSGPAAKPDSVSLLPHVTSKGLSCLNESSAHSLSSIMGPNQGRRGSSYLESDVDPELLITIPFLEPVKIKGISIFSGVSPSQAPKEVKLFINHNQMDFGDAETSSPAQELKLSADDVKGEKLELRLVRFQNVRSLHIMVKSNQEDEETTRIDSIDLFGEVIAGMSSGPLPKHDHEH